MPIPGGSIAATSRILLKAQDILFDISAEALNATYSYLASASPSATSYTFDPAKLGAHATSSSTSISSTASTGSISTGTTASTAHPATSGQSTVTVVASTSNSPSLSGGAIGGIVAGAVIAVMIILGAIYLFLKRGRSQQAPPGPGAPLPGPAHIMPPPDRTLEAEWKPVYETGYTERPYEVEGLTKQVHEAGGLSSTRHELPGH
ncbi:uncharacterized protein N7496_002421 [Penicillium cataractarum]|uniref:Mid2 domain-containing protein n=1 Tax=Penicillium cataractarum TaxID=2100454 RepID=A0A9W9SP90_9EURO|nr:uncharacterized protein N7496_002421 [Penicillium cataractarum]KAJ5379993.1 hypothetical protein N7496_002421 [Penicillium cataractarum]